MDFREALHWIAQGAVNINEGVDLVQANSAVHKAMLALCELANAGRIGEIAPDDVIEGADLVIRRARVVLDGSGLHLVSHPTNDAILAYCDTEEAANRVRDAINAIVTKR